MTTQEIVNFGTLPAGIFGLAAEYCTQREIEQLAQEDATYPEYHENQRVTALFAQYQREDAACLAAGYPQELIDAFKERGFSLWRLPVLDVTAVPNEDGYLYQLALEHMPTGSSVQRFENIPDTHGGVGIAFRVHGREGAPTVSEPRFSHAPTGEMNRFPIPSMHGVIGFTRFGASNEWSSGTHFGALVHKIKKRIHERSADHRGAADRWCDNCPLFHLPTALRKKLDLLDPLLSDTDVHFLLDGPIEQVENPLPEPEVQPPAAIAAGDDEECCCACLCRLLCSLWQSLWAYLFGD